MATQSRKVVSTEDAGRTSNDCFDQAGLPRRFGRYHLLRLLARGGMGQIFLASTTGVEGAERPVVVKVIRREYAKDPNFLARFLDEARVQAQLGQGAAQILEAATHEPTGDPFVVMEYVEGRSLGNVRRRVTDVGLRLRWEEAVAIGALVTEALAYIHERSDPAGRPLGIVHRDLSPHNVMLGYGGEVKVIDFGTARGQNRRCHTVAGVVFAKPGYVAPEVAGGDSGDFRVDLYAAGVMIWELCAGRRFLQGDAQEHMAAVAAGEMDLPPIASDVGAPAELDRVLATMTAIDRDDRYETTRRASTALAALLKDAPPLTNGERGTRARVAQLMYSLYPAQPGRSRREFSRLVTSARKKAPAPWRPSATPPEPEAEEKKDDGTLCGTPYRLRGEIGRGSSSVVYEAEHVELERRVAIKLLDAEHTNSRDFAVRFRREARALSRLHHPGLVRVFDFGQTDDGRLFCAMELLEGQTLRARLEQEERLGWTEALRIARLACRALTVAHQHDLVHRDIKPENIFLTKNGGLRIIDFGLAKRVGELADAQDVDSVAAEMGAMTLFGTPEYMAPEQVAAGRVDHRADIYALGCVLYECLTGRLPFAAASTVEVLDLKLAGNPETVRERAPNLRIPRHVSRLVERAVARHPSRRYESASDMAAAIAIALDAPNRQRNRRRAAGGSVVAAVMAFAVVLLGQQAKPWLQALPAQLPWLDAPTTVPAQVPEAPTQVPKADSDRPEPAPGPAGPPAPAEPVDGDEAHAPRATSGALSRRP
jgi:eukaryotic-like serine/threonine-protein kinase